MSHLPSSTCHSMRSCALPNEIVSILIAHLHLSVEAFADAFCFNPLFTYFCSEVPTDRYFGSAGDALSLDWCDKFIFFHPPHQNNSTLPQVSLIRAILAGENSS